MKWLFNKFAFNYLQYSGLDHDFGFIPDSISDFKSWLSLPTLVGFSDLDVLGTMLLKITNLTDRAYEITNLESTSELPCSVDCIRGCILNHLT